jgi:flagellar motor switch protein FliG
MDGDLAAWNDSSDSFGSGGFGTSGFGGGMGDYGTPVPRTLTKRQKAAVIVRLLLAEGVPLSLVGLPDSLQVDLAHELSTLRFVDRVTLKAVIDEFVQELDAIGLSFPDDVAGALAILDGTISPATASRLRKQLGLASNTDPWPRLSEIDTDKLLPVFERESVQVCAVLISKLKVQKAAELLGRLPGPRARAITYAVSQTGAIKPNTVQKIGVALAEQLEAQPLRAFDTGPVQRLGAILNTSPSATRDDMLAGLDEVDKGFADAVRKAIFTFANIPARIPPRDVPKIVKAVEGKAMTTAIAAALARDPKTAEFLLANMSQRLAQQLREDAQALGTIKDAAAEEAFSAVVAAIREMESKAEITFLSEDEE